MDWDNKAADKSVRNFLLLLAFIVAVVLVSAYIVTR